MVMAALEVLAEAVTDQVARPEEVVLPTQVLAGAVRAGIAAQAVMVVRAL